jgi:hypothetical protein
MALLRETGLGQPGEVRLPYPRHPAPVGRAIAWKPAKDAYHLLAARLRGSGYEHELYVTQRVLLQLLEHAGHGEREVDGTLWGRLLVSPDTGYSYVRWRPRRRRADSRSPGWCASPRRLVLHETHDRGSAFLRRCEGSSGAVHRWLGARHRLLRAYESGRGRHLPGQPYVSTELSRTLPGAPRPPGDSRQRTEALVHSVA